MNSIVTFFGGSIIGGFIGYFIKHFLDIRLSIKIEEHNKKREVYEDMIDSLNVFISGRNQSQEKKEKFLLAYSRLWLWAPDSVTKKVSQHLEEQVKITNNNNSISEADLKKSYAEAVIEMRKDIGHVSTTLINEDYKFVSFK